MEKQGNQVGSVAATSAGPHSNPAAVGLRSTPAAAAAAEGFQGQGLQTTAARPPKASLCGGESPPHAEIPHERGGHEPGGRDGGGGGRGVHRGGGDVEETQAQAATADR